MNPSVPGLNVSRGQVTAVSSIKLCGKNTDVDAAEDIWSQGGDFVAPTAARVHAIVSGDAKDDGDGQKQVETATAVGTIAGQKQVETAVVVGTITLGGNATVTVTAAGMSNSPKAVSVAVAGTKQAEKATVLGTIAVVKQVETAVVVGTIAGTRQIETAVVVGTIAGTQQVETATIVSAGGITSGGNATITVTAAGMPNSPKAIDVLVDNGDSAAIVAGKARAVLAEDEDVTALFAVSGAGADIILTRLTKVANDATLNIASADGTCTGLTAQAASANTTAGVQSSGNATVTVTAAGMPNSPKAISVPVLDGDNAGAIASKIRSALNSDVNVSAMFTVSGADENVILTKIADSANDATLNIAVANGTCNGIVNDATSNDTQAGILGSGTATVTVTAAGMSNSPKDVLVAVADGDNASAIAGKIRTALGLDADVASFFDVSGSNANVVLTAKTGAANDATMNIAVANTSCVGIVDDATSNDTTAGHAGSGNATVTVTADGMPNSPKAVSVAVLVGDTASVVGGKIETALGLDADVSGYFTISRSGPDVTLTRKAVAANDATMNIAIANDTCNGLTAAPASTNLTAGVAGDTAAQVAGKIRTALGLDADVSAFFDVSGADENVILTAKANAANDATMNIAYTNGTCTGLTPDATSDNTTPGIAGTGNALVTITSALLAGNTLAVSVPVTDGDVADAWAAKVRTVLNATAAITEHYVVSGATDKIVLTAIVGAANDATLNIALADDTSNGIVEAANSANTTAGIALGVGARTVLVKGINGSYNAVEETVILNGTAAVNTANSYVFINEMRVMTVGSEGDNAGLITATAAVDGTVSSAIPVGNNRSSAAMCMLPTGYTGYLTMWHACFHHESPGAGTAVGADFAILVKPFGGAFVPEDGSCNSLPGDPNLERVFTTPIKIEAKSQVKIRAMSVTTTNLDCQAGGEIILIKDPV